MKLMIATALLFLVAGMPARGLQQEPDKAKEKDRPRPVQQEEPKKQEREKQRALPPEKEAQQPDRQQEKQQEKQLKDAQRQESERQEKEAEKARRQTEKQQQQGEKQQQRADKDRAKQDHAARERAQQPEQSSAHQTQRDGGNRNARRIREEDFRSHFGDEHHFHVERRDDRRFRYSGYWFEFSDPWPADWDYADDVYIDDIDGEYYLVDSVHPGFRLLVIVVN
jgi:hypothetical protein